MTMSAFAAASRWHGLAARAMPLALLVPRSCDVLIRSGQLGFSWPTRLFTLQTPKPNPGPDVYDDMGTSP